MKLLLDTHVFLWWSNGDSRLSPGVLDALRDPINTRHLSSVSGAEIAVKVRLGKLKLSDSVINVLREQMSRSVISELPLLLRHAAILATLPLHHRDAFDRLLIAQAIDEGMTLVTKDAMIQQYAVAIIS